MPENRHLTCNISGDVPDDTCPIFGSETGLDLLKHDHDIQIEGNATSSCLSEEVLDVHHFFADPQNEKSSGGDGMYSKQEGGIDCSDIDDFASADCCFELKTDCGILNTSTTQGGIHDLKFEFSDGMFQGLEEDKDLYLTGDFLNNCADHFLDARFSKTSNLCYVPTEDASLLNLGSECYSKSLEIGGGASAVMSDLSKTVIPLSESVSDHSTSFLDNMSVGELHEAFKSTFGRDTFINDKEWLKRRIMSGLQSIKEMNNDYRFTESRLPSDENKDNLMLISRFDLSERPYGSLADMDDSEKPAVSVTEEENAGEIVSVVCPSEVDGVPALDLGNKDGDIMTRKRLRKPTRRYIEELSENKSKNCNRKMEIPVSASCNRGLHGTRNQLHYQGSGITSLIHTEFPVALDNQLLPTNRPRRGRPRKNCSLLVKISKGNKDIQSPELSESESQDDLSTGFTSKTRNTGGRRKHHRQWTLSEVMKLIEGVSQYGVGRWTEIKRLFFSSSAYRTSVDLKDKWRNLLRATGAQVRKKEVGPSKKHISLPIPQSITRRVRELSSIYPYPRERKSRSQLLTGSTAIPAIEDAVTVTHDLRAARGPT